MNHRADSTGWHTKRSFRREPKLLWDLVAQNYAKRRQLHYSMQPPDGQSQGKLDSSMQKIYE